MNTVEKVAHLREEYLRKCAWVHDTATSACESPIEQLFVAALLDRGFLVGSFRLPFEDRTYLDEFMGARSSWVLYQAEGEYFGLQTRIQTKMGRYRVDFAVSIRGQLAIVELDGHDFHERTKEQARRDKARDRDLVANGWRVFRFTGSEVFADPHACVSQVRNALIELAAR